MATSLAPALLRWWRLHSEAWGVRALALLVALMGVVNLLSALTPASAGRLILLEQAVPLDVRNGSRLASTLAGLALLLLAANLWRRKRVAWWLTQATLALSILTHLVKGLDYEEASLAAGLIAGLLLLRGSFHARSDPPSIRRGMLVAGAALGLALAYGVLGFYLLDGHFGVKYDLLPALRETVVMLTQFYDPGLEPVTGFGRYFADSIYTVGAASLGYSLWMLVQPVIVRHPATPAERARAQAIVEAHGRSSLARFTLFDDKSYFFSPGGSLVAFVVHGRVALALGDPIGPAEDLAAALTAFREYCTHRDWQPAFYLALPDHLPAYRALGLDLLSVGREAVVDLPSFSLEGKAVKDLRTAVNKLTRLGHHAEVHRPPLSDELLAGLREISDEWLAQMRGSELRFSMGWFEENYLRHSTVITVRTPDGWISAFASIVTEYQRSEVAVDLMRRRPEIEKGSMDYLFASMLEWARAEGYATFSLGLSALSGIGECSDDPAVERALRYIYQHVSLFYNFQGLHAFKEKYHPRWEPRYLVYPGPASLPAVGIALMRVHAGENFVWRYLRR